MPIDPTGTTPGLVNQAKDPNVINARCKRAPDCDSIEAIEIKQGDGPSPPRRLYQCVKCKITWGVNVGGNFEI